MQLILMSCEEQEEPQKNKCPVRVMTPIGLVSMTPNGPVFFCKLLLNGASHETKIGCIRLVWAGA